jgi:PPP family 3-phenylpropionic acid transporter
MTQKPLGPNRTARSSCLFRRPAFVRVVVIAALVHGSHAMYDSLAVIRWTDVGIAPATTAILWSESVAAEVLVFLFLGPRLPRDLTLRLKQH